MLKHCYVVMWLAAAAQAQQPTIAPLSYTAFLDPSDVSVRFTCTGEGVALWRVDGLPASSTETSIRGISTASNVEGGNFTSQIIIPATVENNSTELQCLAVADIVAFSETATFRIQGPLAPPPNLTIEADACSIKLVWSAPFTLDVSGVDPDISTYTICNNITGCYTCSNTSGSGVMEHVFPRPFRYVEFRVSAVNGAGQGNESSVVYKPGTISTKVSFQNATNPSVSISFQVNCSKPYNIVIVGNYNETVYNQSVLPNENGTVVVTGLESNEKYNFTVTENMMEHIRGGPSGSFTTFDVQRVTIYNGPGEINVTCFFAVGSQALGCHVLIYMSTTPVAFGDIRRNSLSMRSDSVFSGLEVGTYEVVIFDIEYDNTIDIDNRLHVETVNITKTAPTIATTDEPTDVSTSATASEVTTATSTTELDATSPLVSTSVTPTNSNQLLVVVVSIAVILVAGVLVLVAVAALVCVVWFRRRKESPSVAHEESDVPVVMRGNDAYQMVKTSHTATGRDGVDMDQCPAYGVVGNR